MKTKTYRKQEIHIDKDHMKVIMAKSVRSTIMSN